jgi:broad specificity phosphatase PhoE
VKAIPQDTVVFSHIIAINVLVGAAAGSDRVMLFTPENCSVTIFAADGDTLTLIQKGEEAVRTKVN